MPPKQQQQLFWVKDEKEGFVLVESHPREPGKYIMRTKTGQKEYTGEVWAANPSDQDGVPDNTQLMHLHEPGVLHNIRARYSKDEIYSYTGYILIAVNPYKSLSMYSDETIQKYRGKSIGALPPHVFAVADRAYRLMKSDATSQSILISGESGAGKTETSKYVMKFLVKVGGRSDLGSEVEERILESNPLMEAFGNAKTIRNNNSSRFGKYMELQFNNAFQVSGSKITTYLLEQTRIVHQAKNERNYHIFYQLCAGATKEERAALKLGSADSYYYLNQGNACTIPGMDDAKEFEHVRASMSCMKLSKETQFEVMKILSGLLHLGNIKFVGNRSDEAIISNVEAAENASSMLGISLESLTEVLLSRKMKTRNESYTIKFKSQEAADQRDVFVKLVYTKLFDWLVEQINLSLESDEEEKSHIGILDIFGFESFEENSFEQLCINFTNETLQNYFNDCIFTQELDLYAREGIIAPKIEYQNNSETMELISKKKVGIFPILDEEMRLPKGKDSGFSEKVFSSNARHPSLSKPPIGLTNSEAFVIKHYAGKVCYKVQNFLQKNNDIKHPDHLGVIKGSSLGLLTKIFHSDELEVHGGSNFNSISLRFCRSLEDLMSNLKSTVSHFIRCIKPNTKQKPAIYEGDMVLNQLRCNGMMAALLLMHSGYPTRCPYDDLHQRFRPMLPPVLANLNPQNFCEALLMALGVDQSEFALGFTKLFFKSGKLAFLEDLRGSGQTELPKDIVIKVRKWLARKRFVRAKATVIAFKKLDRRLRAMRAFAKFLRATKFFLFGVIRFMRTLKRYRKTRRSAVLIQSAYRGFRIWKKYKPILEKMREQLKLRIEEEKIKIRQQREEQERQRLENERLERLRIEEEKARERQKIEDAARAKLQVEYERKMQEQAEQLEEASKSSKKESEKLHSQISELQKTVDELRRENEQLKTKNTALQKKFDDSNGKIRVMEQEFKEKSRQTEDKLLESQQTLEIEILRIKASFQESEDQLRTENLELEAKANSLQNKTISLQRQIADIESTRDKLLRELESEKEELESELQKAQKTVSEIKSKSSISQEKALEYESHIRALTEEKKTMLRDSKATEEKLAEEKSRLQKTLTTTEAKLQAALHEVQLIEETYTKKAAEMSEKLKSFGHTNQEEIDKYELKIVELEATIKMQAEQIQELNESAMSHRRSNRANTGQNSPQVSTVEVNQLKAKVKQVEEQSSKRIRDLETSISLLQMEKNSLDDENIRLKKDVGDKDMTIKELTKAKNDLSNKIFELKTLKTETEDETIDENYALKEKVQELERQKNRLTKDLNECKDKMFELEDRLKVAERGAQPKTSNEEIEQLRRALQKYQETLSIKESEITKLLGTQKEFDNIVDQNIQLKVRNLALEEQLESSASQIAMLSRNAVPTRRGTVSHPTGGVTGSNTRS